ncbi:MAG: hypothetical protein QXH81_10040, partial [Thermofilaceae archaeon]
MIFTGSFAHVSLVIERIRKRAECYGSRLIELRTTIKGVGKLRALISLPLCSRREGMLDENPRKTQKQLREAPAVNAVEEEPASIGELRRRIRELEKALSAYGFDCRRGIETYKVSEIKRILREAGPREGEARV